MKLIKRFFLIFGILIVLLLSGLFINNTLQSRNELGNLSENGERIQTDYGDYHVHTQGEGEPIVFLSGLGTTSPYYDFKPLIDYLDESYKIIVIEKPGYGYNDSNTRDKSLETVVSGLQAVSEIIELSEPFTIMAHSMGGMEAIHWAQKSPDSIKQIVAIDPAIAPMILEEHTPTPNIIERNLQYLIGSLGVSRFMEDEDLYDALPILKYNEFSENEKESIKAQFHGKMFNRNIVREMKELYNNAEIITEKDRPLDTPVLLLLAQENLDSNEDAEDIFIDYFNDFTMVETHILPTDHYIHHEYHREIIDHFIDFTTD